MIIKKRVHNIFLKTETTRKIYCTISYIKGKIYFGICLYAPILKYRITKEKPVFLIFTPEHANLGDHAIAYAEQKLFNKLKIEYYEITGRQLYILQYYGYLKVLNNTTIFINGGGNLGSLWPEIEKMNRWIISELKESTICIMPNSIYYDADKKGQIEFEESVHIYNKHPKLYIYARENLSYELMKKKYKNVKLIPDMVFSLDECISNMERKGCLLCMRNDVERTIPEAEYEKLCHLIKRVFKNVRVKNTVINHNVKIENRESELENIFSEFRNVELVVTDRLHGMIFSAITGTKCIVLNSKSPKIKGCYQWIKHLEYIRMINNIEELESVYKKMPQYPNVYNYEALKPLYTELKYDIKNLIIKGVW